jgi:hypothetical protein
MDVDKFLDEKFAAENEICSFYTNNLTRSASEYVANRWLLSDHFVLLAENKSTKDRDYLLIKNNDVIYSTNNYEQLLYHIDMVGLANQPETESQDQ